MSKNDVSTYRSLLDNVENRSEDSKYDNDDRSAFWFHLQDIRILDAFTQAA